MEAVALSPDLDEVAVVHQAVEKRRDGRRVTEHLRPVCVTKGASLEVTMLYRRWGMAPRDRLIGAGRKPRQAAGVKSLGGER